MTLSITRAQMEAIVSKARQLPEWARMPTTALTPQQRCAIAAEIELHCAIGCLLRSEAFAGWLSHRESRLPWVTGMVYDDLDRELRKGLDMLEYTSAGDDRCWRLAGVVCARRVQRLAERFGIPVPDIREAHFLARDRDTLKQITRWLAALGRMHLLPVSDEMDTTYRLLQRLAIVAQARLTLEQPTGHPGFEFVLSELNTPWLLEGDLFQLLAEDAEHFRAGRLVAQMLLYRDRCRTALFGPDQVPPADDWDEPGQDDYYCREAGWVPSDPAQGFQLVGQAPNHFGYPFGVQPHNREYLIVHFGPFGEPLFATPGAVSQQLRAVASLDFE